MYRFIIILMAFSSFWTEAAKDEKIVLTNTSIGAMPIEVGMKISLFKIRNYFPFHRVTQEIREGDSPDYNVFIVSTQDREELISFISYITKPTGYEESIVKLDEVIIYSPKTQDEFGVSPNMPIKQAVAKRKDLKFGAGHMDNYLGRDKIWYLFSVNQTHGTQVTKKLAFSTNPKIDAISWPYPRWR